MSLRRANKSHQIKIKRIHYSYLKIMRVTSNHSLVKYLHHRNIYHELQATPRDFLQFSSDIIRSVCLTAFWSSELVFYSSFNIIIIINYIIPLAWPLSIASGWFNLSMNLLRYTWDGQYNSWPLIDDMLHINKIVIIPKECRPHRLVWSKGNMSSESDSQCDWFGRKKHFSRETDKTTIS